MLEAIGLSRFYSNVRALHALNLRTEACQIFRLLGANGACKTTTINLFLNFIEASLGESRVNGLNVGGHSLESKKHFDHILEQVMPYRDLTELEDVECFAALAGH